MYISTSCSLEATHTTGRSLSSERAVEAFRVPVVFEAYLERQKRGPDLARLRCSAAADDLVKEMLSYEEPSRQQGLVGWPARRGWGWV